MPKENYLELWIDCGDGSIRYLGRGTSVKALEEAAAKMPQNYQGQMLICDDSGICPHFYKILARKEAQAMRGQPKEVWMIRRADQFADRWTFYGEEWIISASDDPAHPLGVWGFCEVARSSMNTELGVMASWADVPATAQAAVIDWLTPEEAQA